MKKLFDEAHKAKAKENWGKAKKFVIPALKVLGVIAAAGTAGMAAYYGASSAVYNTIGDKSQPLYPTEDVPMVTENPTVNMEVESM